MRYFCFVLLLAVTPVFSSSLQAEVIDDTQIVASGVPGEPTFDLIVFQTPLPPSDIAADPTGVFGTAIADILGATVTLTFDNIALDEGSEWYAVNPNDTFTAQTIADGDFPYLFGVNPGSLGQLVVPPGESFFLGVNTGNIDSPNGDREDFGWVELSVSVDGELTVLDSAVAYDQGGIIVGTSQSVPEPSSAALIGIGIFGFVARRRRR